MKSLRSSFLKITTKFALLMRMRRPWTTLKVLHEAANQGELVLVGDTYGVQIVDIVGEG